MGTKRDSFEADLQPLHTRHTSLKRTKASAHTDDKTETQSSSSASESTAMHSTSPSTDPTSVSSISESEQSSSEESSISSSSSSDEDEGFSEPAPRITEVPAVTRPQIDPERLLREKDKLLTRLRDFMPRLVAANSELGSTASMEEVGEDEAHIEMDLGLGVLEEKRGEDGSEGESEVEEEEGERDEAVMQKLLGDRRKHGGTKPGIQEVDVLELERQEG